MRRRRYRVTSDSPILRYGQKATTKQVIDAYRETGSVWRAALKLGMAGQSVHERLAAIDYPMASRTWRSDEIKELERLAGQETIGEIARRLGRPYAGVAGMISRCGFGSRYGNRLQRKIPRGAGYDKENTRRTLKELLLFQGSLRAFCRARALNIENLVQAIQRHYPEDWTLYTSAHTDLNPATCIYCGATFYPMSGKQKTCKRQCAETKRRDDAYFGGQRRKTIGLNEGVCQLCGQTGKKGLSSHHLIGKDNDPENEYLVALCRGCHQLVGLLAGRKLVDTDAGWENLINLVMIRRRGVKAIAQSDPIAINTIVETEWLTQEDLEAEMVLDEEVESPGSLPA